MRTGIPILNEKTSGRAPSWPSIRHFLILLLLTLSARAQLIAEWDAAAEACVIFNPDFPGSAELAAYYAEQRHIPKERVIGLRCSQENSISRGEFESQLRDPLLQLFESRQWWNAEPPLPGKAVTETAPPTARCVFWCSCEVSLFKSAGQHQSPNNRRKTRPVSILNLPCLVSANRRPKAAYAIPTSISRHVFPVLKTHPAS